MIGRATRRAAPLLCILLDGCRRPNRFWSLTRFQLVVVYNAETMPPRILQILGTARDFAPLLATIAPPDVPVGLNEPVASFS